MIYGILIAALLGWGGVAPTQPATLAVPGRSNAFVSAASDGAFGVVVWGASLPGGTTDVYAAVSRDGGGSFAKPVQVNDIPGEARLSGEQPPRVVIVPRRGQSPAIVVVWTAAGKRGTVLLWARSRDGGHTFTPATLVPGSDAPGNRGWESAALESNGRIGILWLDHRGLVQANAAVSHLSTADPAAEVARAQESKLYFAELDGSNSAQAITGGVCYCCKTTVAAGPRGNLFAAWREVYPGDFRDIAFTTSRDGGRSFAAPFRVHADHWMLDGCPEDGPALAVDTTRRIHLVWPTLARGPGGAAGIVLNYAVSADGRRFSSPVRIPAAGPAHHPVIAISSLGQPWIAWDEETPSGRQVEIARVSLDAHGQPQFTRLPLAHAEGDYPALSPSFLTWTSGPPEHSTIRVAPIDRWLR